MKPYSESNDANLQNWKLFQPIDLIETNYS